MVLLAHIFVDGYNHTNHVIILQYKQIIYELNLCYEFW